METIAGLKTFARVVEAGSFSEAGRQLGVAPSSVSRQINELEDSLGGTLTGILHLDVCLILIHDLFL